MFCGCFVRECFASVLQYFHKTHKTQEKYRKTLETHKKLTIHHTLACVLRAFSKSQEPKIATVLHKTPFTKHMQNTPQNTEKTLAIAKH